MSPTMWVVNHNKSFRQEASLGIITAPLGNRDPYKQMASMRRGDRTLHVLRGDRPDWDVVAVGVLTSDPKVIHVAPYGEATRLPGNTGWRVASVSYTEIPAVSLRRFVPTPAERYFTTSPRGYLYSTQGIYVRRVELLHALQFSEILRHELGDRLPLDADENLAAFSAMGGESGAEIVIVDQTSVSGPLPLLGDPTPLPPASRPLRGPDRTPRKSRRRSARERVHDEAERVRVGSRGEALVLAHEQHRLSGNSEALKRVRIEADDNAGYDIVSADVEADGIREIHIEVKATRSSSLDSFFISPNELAHPQACPAQHRLALVWDVDSESPKWSFLPFEDVHDQFSKEATQFCMTLIRN